MNGLNLNNVIISLSKSNENVISDYWAECTVTSMTQGYGDSPSAILGGQAQTIISGEPSISVTIEKPLFYDDEIFDYLTGDFKIYFLQGTFDDKSTLTSFNGMVSMAYMAEYSISFNAGEAAIISISLVCYLPTYLTDYTSLTVEEYSGEKIIPKMDRICPVLDVFDDNAIYSFSFGETKKVETKWILEKKTPLILESPLLTQKFSASGYAKELKNFPFTESIDVFEKWLSQKNEEYGIKIYDRDASGASNDYLLKTPKLNSLSVNYSDSDYIQFSVELMGTRTLDLS